MVVVGKGSHARAVAALFRCGVLVPYEDVVPRKGLDAIVGIGCSDLRLRVLAFDELAAAGAIDEPGTVVFPGGRVGTNVRIGRNVVIYSGAVVEHDSTIGDHAWLSPGVILCGNVTVQARAFLGAGAIVLPGVTIGEAARIGAGAVIHGDVRAGATVYGPRSHPIPKDLLI